MSHKPPSLGLYGNVIHCNKKTTKHHTHNPKLSLKEKRKQLLGIYHLIPMEGGERASSGAPVSVGSIPSTKEVGDPVGLVVRALGGGDVFWVFEVTS